MNENMTKAELDARGWKRSTEDLTSQGMALDLRDGIWKLPCSQTSCPRVGMCVHQRYATGEAHNGSDRAVQRAELEQIHGMPYEEINFAPLPVLPTVGA